MSRKEVFVSDENPSVSTEAGKMDGWISIAVLKLSVVTGKVYQNHSWTDLHFPNKQSLLRWIGAQLP